jgi:hypothetical protein
MTAGDVLDRAAALLNDTEKSIFTYQKMLPYLNIAIDDLQEILELNNIPITNITSSVFPIAIGETTIDPLPSNLIEIRNVYERFTGTTDQFILMQRVEFLPKITVPIAYLMYWAWNEQAIQFLASSTNIDVKIEYVGSIVSTITNPTQQINVINAKSFLSYRTAALAANFIGENKTRSDELNAEALNASDKMLGIMVKSEQTLSARHRPMFRRR